MKKQILALAALIGLFAATNASANVDFKYVWINTTAGSASTGSAIDQSSCGTDCIKWTFKVYGHVTSTQAKVYKYNPTTLFNNSVWKRGDNGTVMPAGDIFWESGKRAYQSKVNDNDYILYPGQTKTFLTFQYQHSPGGYWGTFLLAAKRF